MAEVTDDENDIDALLEENEDEDPDWSGEALQEDEDDDDEVEDIDDTDDPEWGPKKDENEGNILCNIEMGRRKVKNLRNCRNCYHLILLQEKAIKP